MAFIANPAVVGNLPLNGRNLYVASFDDTIANLTPAILQSVNLNVGDHIILSATDADGELYHIGANFVLISQVDQAELDALELKVDQNTADILDKINASEKGAALGVATLGAGGKIPANQLDIVDENYKGAWDAATNTPTIVSGVGANGDYHIVAVAGATVIDGISSWEIGDTIVFNSGLVVWQRIQGTKTDAEILTVVEKINNATGFEMSGGTASKKLTIIEDCVIDQSLSETSNVIFEAERIASTTGGDPTSIITAGKGIHVGGALRADRQAASSILGSIVYVYGGSDGSYPTDAVAGLRVRNTNVKFDSLGNLENDRITSLTPDSAVVSVDEDGYLRSITLDNLLRERNYSYDSGYVAISSGQSILVQHNLAQKTLAAFLFFTPSLLSSDSAFTCQQGSVTNAVDNTSAGMYVEFYDTNKVYVNGGNTWVYAVDNSHRYGGTQSNNRWASGYFRVLLQELA